MKSIFSVLIAAVLCAGCSSIPSVVVRNSIEPADAKLVAADYTGAQALYAEYANSQPDSPHAARARATQAALVRLLASQSEIDRLKRGDESPRLRRELADRQGELDRLKTELARLRADLERLRSIDLQTLPDRKR